MAAYMLSSATNARQVFDDLLHFRTLPKMYWMAHNLMGEDKQEPGVERKQDIPSHTIFLKQEFGKKKRGDRIIMTMGSKITGAGKGTASTRKDTGATPAERTLTIYVSDWWHGVKVEDVAISSVRAPFDVEMRMTRGLDDWWARKFDTDIFHTFYFGYSKNNIDNAVTGAAVTFHPEWFFPSGVAKGWEAGKEGGLNTNHKMTTRVLNFLHEYALDSDWLPCVYKGDAWFGCVMSESQWTSLFEDPKFEGALQRAAMPGDNNPLWTGAKGMWNGTFIHTSNSVADASGTWAFDSAAITGDGVAGGEKIRRAIYFGGNAIGAGIGQKMKNTVRYDDDHQRIDERGAESIYGFMRADWGGTIGTLNSAIISTFAEPSYLAA